MKEPKTAAEWQEAVDLASCWMLVDAASKYGLISGGAEVNVERCERILRAGRAQGYEPADPAVVFAQLLQEQSPQPPP